VQQRRRRSAGNAKVSRDLVKALPFEPEPEHTQLRRAQAPLGNSISSRAVWLAVNGGRCA
jgi:hypothetical protein